MSIEYPVKTVSNEVELFCPQSDMGSTEAQPRNIRMRCRYCGKMVSAEVQYLRHVLKCAEAALDEVSHRLQAFETGKAVRAYKRDNTYMRYEVVNGKMQVTAHEGPCCIEDGHAHDGPRIMPNETSEVSFRNGDPKQDTTQR